MKKTKKILAMACAMALSAAIAVGGTLAYLTSNDSVTNTFTVGSVGLNLDETRVDEMGKPVDPAERTEKGNEYHLLPNHEYTKDPTVTVLKDSEESYVRMIVTLNYATELKNIFGNNFLPQDYVKGWDENVWASTKEVKYDEQTDTLTYEFRYIGEEYKGTKDGTVQKTDEDIKLDALFDSFKIPGEVNKEQLATLVTKDEKGQITDQFEIVVEAHAIQADGFADAAAAWDAWTTPAA